VTATLAPAQAPSRPAPYLALLAALITVILWASAFVGIRMLGSSYSPGALAFGRIATGAVVLGVIALRYRRPWPRGRTLGLVLAYGVAWFGVYTVALNEAERHIDAGTAALLVNVAPILVAVFAGFLLREGFAPPLVVGIAIAFGGVGLIALGGSDGAAVTDSIGIWLALLAALLYASGVLMQKVALRGVDVLTATFVGCATGAVALLPFAPQFVVETSTAPAGALAGVVYLGVFPTAIAFTTWAYALARTDAGRLTATTLTVPAIAILLSWMILGELPTVLGMVGGTLCLLGVAISRR
jgi:drug/metabolite transporter (DMT)-like permease